MNGQWMGQYKATNAEGNIVVEVDDLGDCFAGRAYLYPTNPAIPHAVAYVRTSDKKRHATAHAELMPIDPQAGEVVPWPVIANRFPGATFASEGTVNIRWTNSSLSLKWSTNLQTEGSATLSKSDAAKPSEYVPTLMEWDDFKGYVADLDYRRFIFRGQKKPWRLRTNYHRTGRADLARFLAEDIPSLHRHLSARTRHLFDRRNPEENGAFFHMIQHHGYPTPLLDWSYSPFVAAFFAYRGIRNSEAAKAKDNERVRIFQFDRERWSKDFNQVQKLTPAMPHFSVLEFVAIENERMIPQQALSGLTNVDDVESYIRSKESADRCYMKVIDIPIKDRPRIMRELSIMGITSGSLFPGLDGTCEEVRERYFSS
ncbi:FRG domain-containing protein [Burkholderia sp. Bp9012]|nr:FRG domain-containing protein [Burkholderia sp. Bp9012]